ncbi:MAG: thioesterase [Phenylobacterium sp. RIFCSPHIGHO2_01_FULL_69_31]|uniref:PaaI family thioesterase n=1 Tax=Phenylobacterium sp. RIFCSPHIGHO2_01_FULL_69_31 TaxID=1801944 RepID=UPI0008BE91CB|nr:PaaI family thioesterase [Phenylobacterium sp. RIFCSPHIGHO2_01_FULL_69_31]OHB29899.1 MAG: thioesterase [Phenylobacterium sp. RIFCSPHIGHO2_01_FULL_69_31]
MSDFNTAPLPERMLMAPHADALGLSLVSVEKGRGVMSAPWREELVGDPETGVIASGVVTALIDHTCGLAINSAMGELTPIATLDLRIDYLRPAAPRTGVTAEAHAYRLTRTVGFVRAEAWDVERGDLVATAQAAFMLNTRAQPLKG